MRVYECKLSYSLVSLGEEVQLYRPEKVADYLRSAFDENPMQEAFYCVYLDRKNHPLGRHLITLGTIDATLVSCPGGVPWCDPRRSVGVDCRAQSFPAALYAVEITFVFFVKAQR